MSDNVQDDPQAETAKAFSQIRNCHLIPNSLYDYLVSDEENAAGKRVAIVAHADGRCTVDLEGFLIAPIGLFTERHLRNIGKRYAAALAAKGTGDE